MNIRSNFCKTSYRDAGLLLAGATEADFGLDVANNVSVITFKTDSNDYIYVPENKIVSDAMLTGVPYTEKTVLVNLGHVPDSKDLTSLISNISNAVITTIGITPATQTLDTSSSTRVDITKHNLLEATRTQKMTSNESFETKYAKLLVLYNDQKTFIANIEQVYGAKGIGN